MLDKLPNVNNPAIRAKALAMAQELFGQEGNKKLDREVLSKLAKAASTEDQAAQEEGGMDMMNMLLKLAEGLAGQQDGFNPLQLVQSLMQESNNDPVQGMLEKLGREAGEEAKAEEGKKPDTDEPKAEEASILDSIMGKVTELSNQVKGMLGMEPPTRTVVGSDGKEQEVEKDTLKPLDQDSMQSSGGKVLVPAVDKDGNVQKDSNGKPVLRPVKISELRVSTKAA